MKFTIFGKGIDTNYGLADYVIRFFWRIMWITVWKILWHKLYWLRPAILNLLGGDVPLKCQFFGSTWIERPHDFKIGEYSSVGPRVHLYNLGSLEIGSHTVISQDAYICGGSHDYNDDKMPLLRRDVKIGSKVWICAGAFICPGVTIGDGAVVGARSVVTDDIPPWTVVAGNPAKYIRDRELKGGIPGVQ